MRTHAAPSCNLRPSLDLLEDRHLLSGGFEAIRVNPPAAIVVAIELQTQSQSLSWLGFRRVFRPFAGGSFSQMQPAMGGFDFAHRDPWFGLGHGFQPHPEIQSQLAISDSQTTSEFQEPSTGAPTYLSMTASSTDSTSQASPPPGAPPPMPGPPPGAVFLSGDFLRFKLTRIVSARARIRSQAFARGQCWKCRRRYDRERTRWNRGDQLRKPGGRRGDHGSRHRSSLRRH